MPDRDRRDGEDREGDELRLPRPVNDQRNGADQDRRETEPQHETARRDHLDGEQDAAEDEPVPDPEREDGGHHGPGRSVRSATPDAGPVGRRGEGAFPSPPPPPPNVSRAISLMPASEPSTPVASIGRIRTFWLGDCASWVKARRYFSATK